MNQTQVREADC